MPPKELLEKTHFITGMLLFGTATSILMKMQLVMDCDGYHHSHTFDKPFFQSVLMFLAMGCVLPISFYFNPKENSKDQDAEQESDPLLNPSIQQNSSSKKESNPLIVMLPCIFDLVASTMMTFGLIYISVSVFQMLRGSMVIFSAIMSRFFLGKRVSWHQIIGIGLCIVALVLVGLAGTMIPQTNMEVSTGQVALGMILVIASQVIQAAQIVTEEFFLRNLNLPPLRVVGYEGVWGLLLMIFVACPLAYLIPGGDYSTMPHNSLENTYDSFICLGTTPMIFLIAGLFMLVVMMYNCYGMMITNVFSAVHRTIFEGVRTACIWITDLIIHVISPSSPFGEIWDNWSWMELGGFLVLFLSSLIYNGTIQLPFLKHEYQQQPEKKMDDESEETFE